MVNKSYDNSLEFYLEALQEILVSAGLVSLWNCPENWQEVLKGDWFCHHVSGSGGIFFIATTKENSDMWIKRIVPETPCQSGTLWVWNNSFSSSIEELERILEF